MQVRATNGEGTSGLVGFGQRLDGRERGAFVHLAVVVQRGGEPGLGGYGGGFGQRHAATA